MEEIACCRGWIDDAQTKRLAEEYGKSFYGAYLRKITSARTCR